MQAGLRSTVLAASLCALCAACAEQGASGDEGSTKPIGNGGNGDNDRTGAIDDNDRTDGNVGNGGRDGGGNDPLGNDPFGNAPPGSVMVRDGATAAAEDAGSVCDDSLKLTLRDFEEPHPDFEDFIGDSWDGLSDYDGLVETVLGADKKPVYALADATPVTSGAARFSDWYRDVAGVNQRIEHAIEFIETRPGVFVYDNDEFFPLDGLGFGNGPAPEHNFLFTTEAHTRFRYRGGELFTFRGDDDLWVFVNGRLAVDLGGVHRPLEETLDFDAEAAQLGITIGNSYAMDIFHAERHTTESNFRIETTIDLTCIENVAVQ